MSSGRPRTLVRLMSSLIVVLSGCGAEPSKKPDEAASRRQVAAKKVLVAWQEPAPNGTVRPILELEAESGTLQEDRGSGSFQRTRSKVYRKGSWPNLHHRRRASLCRHAVSWSSKDLGPIFGKASTPRPMWTRCALSGIIVRDTDRNRRCGCDRLGV